MHKSNERWWQMCGKKYSKFFTVDKSVCEFGSLCINGAIRDHIKTNEWVGVDWVAGKNVDCVSLAHEFKPPHKFDAIVSSSMLEHDPYWELSLDNMINCMKDDGIMILAWQAARSVPHGKRYAVDKKYHALKAGLVMSKLQSLGMYIHEFHYECNLFPKYNPGQGPVVLVAFKDKKYAIGDKKIEAFIQADKV
jgi:SAM-dependent methyltransferase